MSAGQASAAEPARRQRRHYWRLRARPRLRWRPCRIPRAAWRVSSRGNRRGRSEFPCRPPAARRMESRSRCRAAMASRTAAIPRAVMNSEPLDRHDLGCTQIGSRCHVERLAHREQADRHDDDIDAAQRARESRRSAAAGRSGRRCRQAQCASPRKRLATPRNKEAPSKAETVVKASTMSAKYSAGPNSSASLTKSGARKVMAMVPRVPATKEPIAAVARAAAPRPLPGHQISLDRRHDRAGFARRIEQDRGGRTAIHGAVIEAGEHDEGAGRIELAR